MLFNSWIFVGLVLATFFVYYLPMMKKLQVYILLLASFVFYAYDSLALLALLLASGVINSISSYGARFWKNPRLFATTGIIVNLLLLALFKYGGLISSSFLDISHGVGRLLCTLPLPLGISFYTFSGISLVVDAYRGRYDGVTAEERPSVWQYMKNALLYVCFFPKLLAGPIAKSKEFFSEISPKSIRSIELGEVFNPTLTPLNNFS